MNGIEGMSGGNGAAAAAARVDDRHGPTVAPGTDRATVSEPPTVLPEPGATLPGACATLPDARATFSDAGATLPDAGATLPDARAQRPRALEGWVGTLAALAPAGDDAARIDQIRELENVKAACAAAQARITAAFARSQRAAQRAAQPSPSDPKGDTAAGLAGPATAGSAARRRAAARRLAERSSAAQVALARRESPQRGGRYVGLADALVGEMPNTLAALASGVINEWRATLIVRETACLSRAQRTSVDAEIAGRLDGLGDARVAAMVKQIACRMDPQAATRRAARAVCDRRVTLRPAADAMAYLTQLLPVAAAVTCLAELSHAADSHPGGDGRTRNQRMADEAVARLTGAAGVPTGARAGTPGPGTSTPGTSTPGTSTPGTPTSPDGLDRTVRRPRSPVPSHDDPVAAVRAAYQESRDRAPAAPGTPPGAHRDIGPAPDSSRSPTEPNDAVGQAGTAGTAAQADTDGTGGTAGVHGFPPGAAVEISLVITDRSLFAGGDDPALLGGHLPIPAPLARAMIGDLPPGATTWIRRLYTRPGTGDLVTMDARRRTFSPLLRDLLFSRDHGLCRTPWCNAPARHADHIRPFAQGGATSAGNGQSLSEDCNYTRTAPGWSAAYDTDQAGDILVTTPTGHTYRSPTPDLIPGHTRRRTSLLERSG